MSIFNKVLTMFNISLTVQGRIIAVIVGIGQYLIANPQNYSAMKTNRNLQTILLSTLSILLLLSACVSPEKMIEAGDYDLAIYRSLKKMKGKRKKKAKFVAAVEEAFQKITERDMNAISNLEAENRPENWVKINRIHQTIRKRQEMVEPYLPLIDRDGREANFRFVRIDGLERESKAKAAEYYYNIAQELLVQAEQGDRLAARRAYDELRNIDNYYRDYRDKETLMVKARDIGVSHIAFKMVNDASVVLPTEFERELLNLGAGELNTRWKVFHLNPQPDQQYDYQIQVRFTDIDVSPEFVKEREYVDVKEIEDGFEYVLDSQGNVLKDSLGNDVTVPRKAFIQARIFETFQNKFARLSGRIEYIDNRTNNLVHQERIDVEAIFENYAATFRGDRRALTRESKRHIGNRPQPFPTDAGLLLDAADQLKPIVAEKIRYYRTI